MPRPQIPTGFKSISPGLAVRAGRQSVPDGPPAPTLGNRSQNSSTLKALNQIPPPHRCNSWTRSRPLARPLRAFGFAEFLSQFPKLLKSEFFSFCQFTQRSPTPSVNAGLNAATALRLVRRGSPLRPERNLCSHPRHPMPQPRRGAYSAPVKDQYLIGLITVSTWLLPARPWSRLRAQA